MEFSNMMDGSNFSLDSVQDLTCPDEKEVMVTEYWPDVPLFKIWIPRNLLSNRMKPSDNRNAQGIFHMLQKKGHQKCMESFTTYSDSDSESEEEEIFQSDNEDEVSASNKDCHVASHNSLTDILDRTSEIPMTEYKRDFVLDNVCDTEKKKTNKKSKKKKKEQKSVPLDKFLEDYTDERKQEDYCNDYLQKLLLEKGKGDECQMRSTIEFPNLHPEKIEFFHGEKLEKKDLTFKSAAKILAASEAVCETNDLDKIPDAAAENVNTVFNIMLENVPSEVSQEDIISLLCGYGEILTISLDPDGVERNFLIAFVKISMTSDIDIDWVIECLNGAEPFGVSSKPLKCHKLP